MKKLTLILLVLLAAACSKRAGSPAISGSVAQFFSANDSAIVSISPYDGSRDTFRIERPLNNIVCMSGSYLGYLSAICKDSVVSALSGIGYVSNPLLKERYEKGEIYDVGYEAAPDYERIVSLRPDLLLTYKVSSGDPPYIEKLKELGIRVMVLYEHLESHPLARASYIRLFGALTGRLALADSILGAVSHRYDSLVRHPEVPLKVLVNVPYSGRWYIPGGDNYMSRLIRDAGGEVLGAREGRLESGVISSEEALLLGREADFWLNTGSCNTKETLLAQDPVLSRFEVPAIYNNTKRATPGGGNDFWESGPVRPDLILEDLEKIFDSRGEDLHYYIEVR